MTGTHLFDGWSKTAWALNIAAALFCPWVWFPMIALALVAERLIAAEK